MSWGVVNWHVITAELSEQELPSLAIGDPGLKGYIEGKLSSPWAEE